MTKTIDEKLAGTNPEEWTEATVAAYHEDGTHARLQRHLDPSRIGDETSLRRAVAMIRAMGSVLNGPYTGSELPVRLLGPSVALRRAPDLWARYEDELLQEVFAFMSKPGMEATFRSAVTFDLDDVTVRRLFSELGADRAEQVAAIDEQLRAEGRMRGTSAETKRRIAAARDAMGLVARAPVKALALKDGPGTDGGPLLLVPVEAVEAWEGTSSPSRPIEAKFRFGDPRAPATDYDRACDVSEQRVGVLDVGEWRGLVLGHTGCRFHVSAASCLIVMEGHGEDVAEALASSSGWTAIPGTLEVPSGKLVLFDATAARGKTREKKTLTVAPGTYTVSEFHRLKPWLWIARLSRSGGDGGTTKAASPAKKTARRK